MIDPRLLRDDPDRVRAAQAKRGLSADVVDEALAADERRRSAIAEFERLRAEQKQLGKQIPQAQGEEKPALLARTKTLAAEVKAAEAAQTEAEEAWRAALMAIPNPAADEAPAGGEDDYVVLETVGTPRDFAAEGFEPRDHVELGRMLGAIDIERGAKVSGARFYFLTGIGAELELALVNMAMDQARDAGFTPMIPPSLVKPRAMEGTGFLGQAADDVYRIEGEDLYLVGTSEVPLAAYHSDEILDGRVAAAALRRVQPVLPQGGRLARQGHPRHHPGALVRQGRDVRLHDASRSPTPSTSGCSAGRRSSSTSSSSPTASSTWPPATSACRAQRKFDCEAWIPTQGKYRELTSTSNCTDFQARRLDIRGRFDGRRLEAARHPQRHAVRDHPHDRRDPGDPPAGRRLGAGAGGAAALPAGPRGPGAGRCADVDGCRARALVALDIDGTLLQSIERSTGLTSRRSSARRCTTRCTARVDAGAHVVLATRPLDRTA